MCGTYLVGVIAVAAVSLLWVGVQNAWRTAFGGVDPESDVLSGRSGCDGCTCGSDCEHGSPGGNS